MMTGRKSDNRSPLLRVARQAGTEGGHGTSEMSFILVRIDGNRISVTVRREEGAKGVILPCIFGKGNSHNPFRFTLDLRNFHKLHDLFSMTLLLVRSTITML